MKHQSDLGSGTRGYTTLHIWLTTKEPWRGGLRRRIAHEERKLAMTNSTQTTCQTPREYTVVTYSIWGVVRSGDYIL